MAYLEELLPEFRKGAKIRQPTWNNGEYIYLGENGIVYDERNKPFDFTNYELFSEWELYKDTKLDYDYIIKNKCLCFFYDDEIENGFMGLLVQFYKNSVYKYYARNLVGCGSTMKHCRPVRRDEVTFYEDKKDE